MFLQPAWNTVVNDYTACVANLPALAGAAVVMGVTFVLAGSADRLVTRVVRQAAHQPSLGQALGNITKFVVVMLGLLVACTLVFPSVKPVDILSFLGFGGVAVGFAFKDIFQNFLAGLMLLIRQPFHLGDEIRVGANEGTVEDINLRSTVLATAAGERVILPNSDVFSQPVIVKTAIGKRRASVVVAVEDAPLEKVKQAVLEAVADVEGVLSEPGPEAVVQAADVTTPKLEVFFWSKPREAEFQATADRVAIAARNAVLAERPDPKAA